MKNDAAANEHSQHLGFTYICVAFKAGIESGEGIGHRPQLYTHSIFYTLDVLL